MKKLIVGSLVLASIGLGGQTGHRKTRSDKGKTHSHTTTYVVKKALKPKSTKTTKKKK